MIFMASKKMALAAIAVAALAVSVTAQPGTGSLPGVPGKDRPIRVGFLKSTGTSRYWHSNIHTAATAIGTILANPSAAALGDNMVYPDSGFKFNAYGVTNTTQCNADGCKATVAQVDEFITALDSLDVIIMSCIVEVSTVISSTPQRTALQNFWNKKGYVGIHAITDTYGTWAPIDSLHAARFNNHPGSPSERTGKLRLDSVGSWYTDSSYQFLNRGLADTTFTEEWFSFRTNGDVIRAYPGVRTTINIDENSYGGGMGGARVMGADHPMSWYRKLDGGGRMFYTAVGHRVQNYQGGANPRFLRRQLYNAIMWTAKYDSTKSTGIRYDKAPGRASDYASVLTGRNALTVSLIQPGDHSVEILGVDGKRVAFQKGTATNGVHNFTNLRAGVYAVSVATSQGRTSRLVTLQ
jgi:type 1 glutamine amidotransferase